MSTKLNYTKLWEVTACRGFSLARSGPVFSLRKRRFGLAERPSAASIVAMTQSSPTGAVSGRDYVRTRPRGFVPWTPRSATRVLLDQVHQVLEEYRPDLPVTARQIFYRLVGKHHYDKTEQAYARLLEMLT